MVKSKLLSQFKEVHHSFCLKSDVGLDKSVDFTLQVHSTKVIDIDRETDNLSEIESDGMITRSKRFIGIKTADCLPVLFYDPVNKVVGAIHAGWRGLSGGILENAVKVMRAVNSLPPHIFVAVGPHIKSCCYSVTSDRIEKFAPSQIDKSLFIRQGNSNLYLDLGKFAFLKLSRLGIPSVQIEISELCTSCDKRFYSFRRDGKDSGRMVNLIGFAR